MAKVVLTEADRAYNEAICGRLKAVRIRTTGGRGQCHFAAMLGLSPSTYNYYEKGRLPPADVLNKVSNLTGAPLLWLIRGEPATFSTESLPELSARTSDVVSGGLPPAPSTTHSPL